MKKTEMMKRYEAETGEILDIDHLSADANGSWYGYIEELEGELRGLKALNKWSKEELTKYKAKAEAYDRIMGGGKKTPKDVANFLGKPIAMDRVGAWYEHKSKPLIGEGCCEGMWVSGTTAYVKSISVQIDYSGDWKDSLTLPDGWEEK